MISIIPISQTNEYHRIYNNKARKLHPKRFKAYAKKSYLKNKEKNNQISRDYHAKNRERISQQIKKKNQLIKLQVFNHYSNGMIKCNCCAVVEIDFLTLDHINGGGTQQRKLTKGTQLYRWVIKNKFPEGFQVLCFNCNCGRGLKQNKGVCPHKKELVIFND